MSGGPREAGEDLFEPSLEQIADLAVARGVPDGQTEPLLEIPPADLGGLREASEDLGLGFGHLLHHEPVLPGLEGVGHQGGQLEVDAGDRGDGRQLLDGTFSRS